MCHYKQRFAELVASHDFPFANRSGSPMPAPADPAASDSEILTERASGNVVNPRQICVFQKKLTTWWGFDHINQLLVTGVRSKTPPFSF